jgi:FkbM family methyltransferase
MQLMTMVRHCRYIIKVLEGKDLYLKVDLGIEKEKLGTEYGGYFVNPQAINADSIVYSLGVGEDVTFDLALIKKFGCKVFGFDPTPKSINWIKSQKLPKEYEFLPFGISDIDGKTKFFPVFKNPSFVSHTEMEKNRVKGQESRAFEAEIRTLPTVMKLLGHNHIDLLKMDIEGAEYKVIDSIEKNSIDVKQICLEFHHTLPNGSIKNTMKAVEILRKLGFKLFYQNHLGEGTYSFLKRQENRK